MSKSLAILSFSHKLNEMSNIHVFLESVILRSFKSNWPGMASCEIHIAQILDWCLKGESHIVTKHETNH